VCKKTQYLKQVTVTSAPPGKVKKIFPIVKKIQKLDIRILKGVNYTVESGVEFIKDFKELNNFIFQGETNELAGQNNIQP